MNPNAPAAAVYRPMSRLLAFALAVALALLGAGAASAQELKRPPNPQNSIRVNIASEPETLDSSLSSGIPEHKVLLAVMEPLVRLDAKAQPIPGVAEKWEHNADYTSWTFHLRKNAKWHNGDPVTAKDFEFAIRRILDPKTQARYADFVFKTLKGGEDFYKNADPKAPLPGLEVKDDHTIVYNLAFPAPYFPSVVAHTSWFPQHAKTVLANPTTWSNSAKTFVGNGAYRIEKWTPNDRMIVKRADTYWGKDEVGFEEVVFRMIEDESTELAAFMSGELDITDKVPLAEVNRLKTLPEWTVGPYLGTYYVLFNTTAAPFDNADVRRAFAHALDTELIVKQITRRGEPAGAGIVPPGIVFEDGSEFREWAGPVAPKFDPAKAKELLAKGGYGPGKKFPAVTYLYNTTIEHRQIGEQMQQMWKTNLGVNVKLENVEWKEKLRRGHEQEFDLLRAAWIADYLDPMSFLEIFTSDSGNNEGKFKNAEYDRLVSEARKEGDWQKRRELMKQAEAILIGEAALVPIYHYTNPYLMSRDMEGVVRNALGNLDVTRARRTK